MIAAEAWRRLLAAAALERACRTLPASSQLRKHAAFAVLYARQEFTEALDRVGEQAND